MLMSALPANSHIENARKKENKRHKRRLTLLPTLAELISEFSGIEERFCESLKRVAPSQEKLWQNLLPQSKFLFSRTLV